MFNVGSWGYGPIWRNPLCQKGWLSSTTKQVYFFQASNTANLAFDLHPFHGGRFSLYDSKGTPTGNKALLREYYPPSSSSLKKHSFLGRGWHWGCHEFIKRHQVIRITTIVQWGTSQDAIDHLKIFHLELKKVDVGLWYVLSTNLHL